MLYIAHDLPSLRGGKVSSLGILLDIDSETGDICISDAGLSPGNSLKTRGVSFLLAVTGASHSYRKVTATLEDTDKAAAFLQDLRNVIESKREGTGFRPQGLNGHLNGDMSILKNITPQKVDGGIPRHQKLLAEENYYQDHLNGNMGMLKNISPPKVDGGILGHQKLLSEENYYQDHTSMPLSEPEAEFSPAGAIWNDPHASPALQIIREELQKLRAEQTRQARRQEALLQEVERALVNMVPVCPMHHMV
jgi:hypothetical protein